MLPLLPVIVTCVAFAAVTVRVDELPEVIVPGLAAMVTVGAGRAGRIIGEAGTAPGKQQ